MGFHRHVCWDCDCDRKDYDCKRCNDHADNKDCIQKHQIPQPPIQVMERGVTLFNVNARGDGARAVPLKSGEYLNFISNTLTVTATDTRAGATVSIEAPAVGPVAPPVIPQYDPAAAATYVVGQLVMYNGQPYVVVTAPPTGTPDTSADYLALGGGGGTTPTGQIINVDSGVLPVALVTALGGAASTVSYVGGGGSLPGVELLGEPINLPILDDSTSSAVAVNGIVDSFVANYTTDLGVVLTVGEVTVQAQLYYAAPGVDEFTVIPGSAIDLDPTASLVSLGEAMTGTATGINFQ
ncbi:MAG: hypothetical protein LBU77_03425, partial [Clostridiales bacterium]|nr:hypothetical protein [Clostridiales bacterium]